MTASEAGGDTEAAGCDADAQVEEMVRAEAPTKDVEHLLGFLRRCTAEHGVVVRPRWRIALGLVGGGPGGREAS